ncbi:unnamed protein product, partial [Prunus brigantina]
ARFAGARTSGSEASGTRTVVTIDDDSDDGDTTESEASIPEQEDVDNVGDMHEGSDKNDNYDHDRDAFVPFDDYTEEQGGSGTFSGFVGSSVHPIGVELVIDIAEGSNLVVAIVDPAHSAPEIGHVAQNMEIVPVVAPSFDTLDTLVEAALAKSSPTMTSKIPGTRHPCSKSQARCLLSSSTFFGGTLSLLFLRLFRQLFGATPLLFTGHCPLHPTFNHFLGRRSPVP